MDEAQALARFNSLPLEPDNPEWIEAARELNGWRSGFTTGELEQGEDGKCRWCGAVGDGYPPPVCDHGFRKDERYWGEGEDDGRVGKP